MIKVGKVGPISLVQREFHHLQNSCHMKMQKNTLENIELKVQQNLRNLKNLNLCLLFHIYIIKIKDGKVGEIF